MSALGLTSVVTRAESFAAAEVDGEIVAVALASGACYALGAVGSRVWALLAAPARVDAICDVLLREFAVDRATCEAQVLELLEDFRREGMLVLG